MILAQVADPASSVLLQYGAIGAIAALALFAVRVLFKQITANADKDRARADRLEEELRKANADMKEQALTTLAAATRAITTAMDALRADRR